MAEEFVVIPKDQLLDLIKETVAEELAPIKAIIAVKQREACEVSGITDDTARNKVKRGEVDAMSKDGSNRIFFTLESLTGLKSKRATR
jgi:hypothetical protein